MSNYLHNYQQQMVSEEFLRSTWSSYCYPPTTLVEMNVKETAVWLLMLCGFKGWAEARSYAQTFRDNEISGFMLASLTVQTLKDTLDILKLGHRLEIIDAIQNNECTLTNPTIRALRPNMSFGETIW